jgi:hypothetical protein
VSAIAIGIYFFPNNSWQFNIKIFFFLHTTFPEQVHAVLTWNEPDSDRAQWASAFHVIPTYFKAVKHVA